jgi:hypothetical protein
MKNITCSLIATVAAVAVAQAGTSSAGGKGPVGKGVVTPVSAECPPLSYNNAELGYIHFSNDSVDLDGGYIDLTYSPIQNVFVELTDTLFSDSNELQLGAGVYYSVAQGVDLTLRGGYSLNTPDEGDSVNGWYIAPGFRAQITCNLELFGKAYYSDDENSGSGTWSYGGGLVYSVNEQIGLVGGAAFSQDNAWSIQAGIRYNF